MTDLERIERAAEKMANAADRIERIFRKRPSKKSAKKEDPFTEQVRKRIAKKHLRA